MVCNKENICNKVNKMEIENKDFGRNIRLVNLSYLYFVTFSFLKFISHTQEHSNTNKCM